MKMCNEQFTLLIGSFARGSGDINSDIDILRIGHTDSFPRPANIDRRIPVSYVDQDPESFLELYDKGSLFLYHVFFEGKLLSGDSARWTILKRNFVVSDSFSDYIEEYLEVLDYIDRYPNYYLSAVPYLSNIFKCLKNIGIFRLASKKKFNFDKAVALESGCGLMYSDAQTLIMSNAVYERSTRISSQLMMNFRMSADVWKSQLNEKIKRLSHDI